MRGVRFEVFWRVALVQLLAVALLSLLLGGRLLARLLRRLGLACGSGRLAALRLAHGARGRPRAAADARCGRCIAGLVSLLAVLIGLHWLGALVAVGLFAYFCAIDARTGSLRPG